MTSAGRNPILAATLMAAVVLTSLGGCEKQSPAAKIGSKSESSQNSKPAGELILYCGRSKVLIEPLVERFRKETGIRVKVRYGTDSEVLATLAEEGDRSPADLFWANTTGGLGGAVNAGLLTKLPNELLAKANAFVPSGGLWTPVTARFRVLAYRLQKVRKEDLPSSVLDLPRLKQYAGRIGWTPTYSSFQDFITAMRLIHGREPTKAWLLAMKDLQPKAYATNPPMMEAMLAGEIDVGLTNHYYVARVLYGGGEGEYEYEGEVDEDENVRVAPREVEERQIAEAQAKHPIGMHHFAAGDVGNLALVTGAGVLKSSKHAAEAHRFLEFLLSRESQRFAALAVHEYPLAKAMTTPRHLLPLDQAIGLSPKLDFERLRELDETLKLLREVGIL